MRDSYSNGNILYLDYVNINILAVMLYYTCARYCNWGDGVDITGDFSVYVLKLLMNL